MDKTNVQWNSKDYRQNSSAQFQWAQETLARLDVAADAVVLDIGCGDGRITRELARKVPQGSVVGIDASESMIELAAASFSDVSNLRFERMDAQKIVLPEHFDLAFSNAALHWFKDHDAFLASLHRHMKSGGRLQFNCGGKGNAAGISEAMFAEIQTPEWKEYFPPQMVDPANLPYAFFDAPEYEVLLKRHGFDPTHVAIVYKEMLQEGWDGLAGWLRTTWMPFTSRVPEESREKFIAQVVARYAEGHPLNAEGKSVVRMSRLVVEAVRP
jgi:trans-aconitate methyltransferase